MSLVVETQTRPAVRAVLSLAVSAGRVIEAFSGQLDFGRDVGDDLNHRSEPAGGDDLNRRAESANKWRWHCNGFRLWRSWRSRLRRQRQRVLSTSLVVSVGRRWI